MKLAITISGDSLQSPFDARFGRSAAFCLADTETDAWTVHLNPALSAFGGAGVQAAQFIAGLGAQAVVSGAYGPNAHGTLTAAGIEMYIAHDSNTLTAADILAQFKAGKLGKAGDATHEGHQGRQGRHGGRYR